MTIRRNLTFYECFGKLKVTIVVESPPLAPKGGAKKFLSFFDNPSPPLGVGRKGGFSIYRDITFPPLVLRFFSGFVRGRGLYFQIRPHFEIVKCEVPLQGCLLRVVYRIPALA